ncbi:MAG: S41 family peptidase [Prevotella sp.]
MNKTIVTIASLLAFGTIQAQKISREQASEDIDSLIYTLSEVHPNLYSQTTISDFHNAIMNVKTGLTDSVSSIDIYNDLAPVISQLGDAHTGMVFPYQKVMTQVGKYLPIYPTIDNNTGKLYVKASVDNVVPYDSEIISINGKTAEQMVTGMKAYVSGERDFFRLSMTDNNIIGLFHLLFSSDEYKIVYRESNTKKTNETTLQPVDGNTLNSRLVLSPKILRLMKEHQGNSPYTFRILENSSTAVMNFDVCHDAKGMETFADSMFTVLKERKIKNLIIDVRLNGGGDSKVGDALLRHISPRPFTQYGKTYVRITPTTKRLGVGKNLTPGIYFYPESNNKLKEPLPSDKRYSGKVFLLTSHTTFSSASSFAWAFKQYGCGTVIGEETGGMSVHYGDILTYTLPHSGLLCNISHKRFWQPGADETSIHGVIPDVITKQDSALETAINIINRR